MSMQTVKIRGQRSRSQRSKPNLAVSGRTVTPVWIHIWQWNDGQAWCGIGGVPYCFSKSPVKFQGHTWQKIHYFWRIWAFPNSNSSLNWLMATNWRAKLEAAQKRCHIVFWGRLSNFKVTRDKTSILTQIGRVRIVPQVWIHWWLRIVVQSLK